MNKKNSKLYALLALIPLLFCVSSCSTNRSIAYFQDMPQTPGEPIVKRHQIYTPPKIKAEDMLSVSIRTLDPVPASSAPEAESAAPVYLVDKNGNIALPVVGTIKAEGLSTAELRNAIAGKASKFYIDPVVAVSFANFTISVLGEVNKPGAYTITNERTSVLDAIGLAGDMAITGRKDNVLLVREENGSKVFVRLDVRSSDFIQSPYFYLQTGDVLYIEPVPAKVNSMVVDRSNDRYIPYIFSGISVLMATINFILLINRQ